MFGRHSKEHAIITIEKGSTKVYADLGKAHAAV